MGSCNWLAPCVTLPLANNFGNLGLVDTYGVVNRKQNQMEKPHTQLSSCAGIPKVLYDAGYNLLSGLGFLAALQAVAWRYM